MIPRDSNTSKWIRMSFVKAEDWRSVTDPCKKIMIVQIRDNSILPDCFHQHNEIDLPETFP